METPDLSLSTLIWLIIVPAGIGLWNLFLEARRREAEANERAFKALKAHQEDLLRLLEKSMNGGLSEAESSDSSHSPKQDGQIGKKSTLE